MAVVLPIVAQLVLELADKAIMVAMALEVTVLAVEGEQVLSAAMAMALMAVLVAMVRQVLSQEAVLHMLVVVEVAPQLSVVVLLAGLVEVVLEQELVRVLLVLLIQVVVVVGVITM